MTTRRTLLRVAAGTAGVAALGACSRRTASRPASEPVSKATAELLFVTTASGLMVLDATTARPTLPAPAALATPNWGWVVAATADKAGTRVVTRDAHSGRVVSGGVVRGELVPRVVSTDGRLVALATPAGSTARAPYPAGRTQTTIAVIDSGGERARLTLAGNLEPEAFSADGRLLFALDYLPPAAPDRYRVRSIDLATGQAAPLFTKLKVPVPAEETMRGEGRQAVYDADRKMLFTLYTHQPDHLHTRDLVAAPGARDNKPHVHAFVHSLHLEQGWAYCIDLPSPFGEGPAAAHAITIAPHGQWLYVLDASTGKVARVNPDVNELAVAQVHQVTAPGQTGAAAATTTADGGLVFGAGKQVVAVPIAAASNVPKRELTVPTAVRGVAAGAGSTVYVGQDDAVICYDLATGGQLRRIAVPGLVELRHVTPALA
jgi:hypothetical protein